MYVLWYSCNRKDIKMSVIKEENILKNIPLSIVKAGQFIQTSDNKTYVVVFKGQERYLVPVTLNNFIHVNIHDVEQPDIIRVFDNKSRGKCLYVKKSTIDESNRI